MHPNVIKLRTSVYPETIHIMKADEYDQFPIIGLVNSYSPGKVCPVFSLAE
jgi:hypothetical protein